MGDPNTITLPNASTDKGHVLWSLIRKRSQTGEELRANTGILGAQSRIHNLIMDHHLPIFTTSESKTRDDGKVVTIVRYHINYAVLDLKDKEVQDFLILADILYQP